MMMGDPPMEPTKINPNFIVASDHRGFQLKKQLIEWMVTKSTWINLPVIDVGTFSEDRVDYPDVVASFATAFEQRGIIICGSGFGVSIAANRYKNIRAVVARTGKEVEMARLHNDANVLCLGADFTNFYTAQNLVAIFMRTKFEGGRHAERVAKLGEDVST